MMKTTLLTLLLAAAGAAQAHIVLDQAEAPAGSAYRAAFRVGHGCAGAATRQIVLTLPAGLRGAKPQPKPGWTLTLRRAKLAQPYESHGRQIDEELAEVSWSARSEADYLQDDWVDEFVLRAQLPQQAGPLWFKLRQVCTQGESNWSELPTDGAGTSTRGLKQPAVLLMLSPAAAPAHAH